MSKTIKKDSWIPNIQDTPENVAKALMNPPKNNVIRSKQSVKIKKRKNRQK